MKKVSLLNMEEKKYVYSIWKSSKNYSFQLSRIVVQYYLLPLGEYDAAETFVKVQHSSSMSSYFQSIASDTLSDKST